VLQTRGHELANSRYVEIHILKFDSSTPPKVDEKPPYLCGKKHEFSVKKLNDTTLLKKYRINFEMVFIYLSKCFKNNPLKSVPHRLMDKGNDFSIPLLLGYSPVS